MKKLSQTLLLLFAITLKVNAQNSVAYSYDANGNRETRYFVGLRPATPDLGNNSDSINIVNIAEELTANNSITVYPNPTKDQVVVTIMKDNTIEIKKADLTLIDNSGKILDQKKYSGGEISFDLSTNPPGNYYITILFEDKSKLNYNVIKVN